MQYSETIYHIMINEPKAHTINDKQFISTFGPDVNILDLQKLREAYHTREAPVLDTAEDFKNYLTGEGLEEGIQFWVDSETTNLNRWRAEDHIDIVFENLRNELESNTLSLEDLEKLSKIELMNEYVKKYPQEHNLKMLRSGAELDIFEKKIDKFLDIYLVYGLRVFWEPGDERAPGQFEKNFHFYRLSELVWELSDHPLLNK